MKSLVLLSLQICIVTCLVCVLGTPRRGYGGGQGGGGGVGGGGGGGGSGYGGNGSGVTCSGNQIPDANGICVDPEVLQNVFVYNSPSTPPPYVPRPYIPKPKLEVDVVYVRTPEQPETPEPIVIPPPQKRTLVYVLTKNGETEQRVIEVPAGPGQTPQVFYVNYDEGDNPVVGGGLTLQEVLSQQGQQGQLIGGNGSGNGGYSAQPPASPPVYAPTPRGYQ